MDHDILSLCDEFGRLLARCDKWEQRQHRIEVADLVGTEMHEHMWDVIKRGLAQFETLLKSRPRTQEELYPFMERVCTLYLRCNSVARSEIRTFVAGRYFYHCRSSDAPTESCTLVAGREDLPELLLSYADHLAARIRCPSDAPTLQLALAAVLIEYCNIDWRDTLLILADLYVGAEGAGIAPKPYFKAAGKIAADGPATRDSKSLSRTLRFFGFCSVLSDRKRRGRPYRIREKPADLAD